MAKKNTIEIILEAKDEATKTIEKSIRNTTKDFASLNSSLKRLGIDSKEIGKINDQIKEVKPNILENDLKNVGKQLQKLGLKDNEIKKIADELDNAKKESNELKNEIKKTERSFDSFKDAAHSASKVAAGAFVAAGAAIATAIGGALTAGSGIGIKFNADMQQFQSTLATVLKSEDEAIKKLEWAKSFAASTPFEIPGIVEAITKLEAYGLKSQEMLPAIGDMAAVMGKDVMQAVEAVADAQTGELERLKEFGITKNMIIDQAAEMGMKGIVNAKGQITDIAKFNEALMDLMEERFKGGMKRSSEGFYGMMSNLKDSVNSFLGDAFKPAFDEMQEIIPQVTKRVGELSEAFKNNGWAGVMRDIIPPDVLTAFDTLNKWVGDLDTKLKSGDWAGMGKQLGEGLSAMLNNLGDLGQQLADTLIGLMQQVNWIETGKKAVEFILGFAIGVADGVFDVAMWGRILKEGWQEILGILVGLVAAPAKIIGPIAKALSKIPLVGTFLSWIVKSLNDLGGPVRAGISNFFKDMWSFFSGGIAQGIKKIEFFPLLKKAFTDGGGTFKKIGSDLYLKAGQIAENLGKGLGEKVTLVKKWASDLLSNFDIGFTMIIKNAVTWGKNIIEGLWEGIKLKKAWIESKVTQFSDDVASAIKDFFGIRSPSKLMAEYGANIAQGLAKGMDENADIVKKISDKLAAAAHSKLKHVKVRIENEIAELREKLKVDSAQMAQAINDAFGNAKDMGSTLIDTAKAKLDLFAASIEASGDKSKLLTKQLNTLSQQIAIQYDVVQVAGKAFEDMNDLKGENAIETKKLELAYYQEKAALEGLRDEYRATNKALKEQGNAFANMAKDIQKVADTYRQDMAKAATEYWNKISDVNNRLREDEKRLTDDYKNQVAQRASALKNFAGLFDEIATKEVSGAGLLKNLRDQVGAFKTWATDIRTLAARGVDQGLIAELQEMGPKAGPEIAALNSLTSEQLNEYVALWQEKAQAANVQALGELDNLRTETESKISQLRQAAMAEIEQYTAEWANKNAEIAQNALDTVAEIEKAYAELTGKSTTFGKDFMQGIIDGMQSKFLDLVAMIANVQGVIGSNGSVGIMPTSGTISGQTSVDSLNSMIEQAKTSYANATNDKERAAAHALAEWARNQGGTVGGGEGNRFKVPGLKDGGNVTRSGFTMVGEEGPELLNLPRGSQVTPLDKAAPQVIENHYHFAPGAVVIPAKDLKEMRDIQEFFDRFPQVARAMGVAR
ncbi:MAG: tape measure protein [Bacillota bacterium]